MSEINNGDMADAQQVGATNARLVRALEEIVKNDPFNQSSAGSITRAALASPVKVGGDVRKMSFEAWYAKYHDDACTQFGGIDCTNPNGIAQDAWDAALTSPEKVGGYAPTDDDIKRFALEHIAPHAKTFAPDKEYKETEQFRRVKAYTLALLGSHAAKVGGDERNVQSHFERQGWEVLPIHTFSELTEAIRDYVQARAALSADGGEDKQRLSFLIAEGAMLRHTADGEYWCVGRYQENDSDLVWLNLGPLRDSQREAIDAAIAAIAAKAKGEA